MTRETILQRWPRSDTGGWMKAVTLYPTWAVLIAIEAKGYETRSWGTSHRGPIAITSSARITDDDRQFFDHESYFPILSAAGFRRLEDLPLAGVLCTALLTGVFSTADVRGSLSEQERAFGNYGDGRFAWRLEGVERFKEPIPCVGNRQLWDIDLAAARALARKGQRFGERSAKPAEPDLFKC